MNDEAANCLSREDADKLIDSGLGQYRWYDQEATKAERALARVTWAGIIAGLLASALAAAPEALLGQPASAITR